jgi:hypothetical protein
MKKDRIELRDETLEGENLTGLRLKQFTATQCSFRSCRFDGSTIEQACFGGGTKPSDYTDCSFDGARITAVAPGVARFIRCSFRDCLIQDLFGVAVEFIDCIFSGTIKKAVFWGSIPEEDRDQVGRRTNEFRGNDFSQARLVDVAFRGGIDLAKQKLPESAGYLYLPNAAAALKRVRENVTRWRDLDLRRRTLALVKALESDVDGGQAQLFLSLDSVSRNQRAAVEILHRELRQAAQAHTE